MYRSKQSKYLGFTEGISLEARNKYTRANQQSYVIYVPISWTEYFFSVETMPYVRLGLGWIC